MRSGSQTLAPGTVCLGDPDAANRHRPLPGRRGSIEEARLVPVAAVVRIHAATVAPGPDLTIFCRPAVPSFAPCSSYFGCAELRFPVR